MILSYLLEAAGKFLASNRLQNLVFSFPLRLWITFYPWWSHLFSCSRIFRFGKFGWLQVVLIPKTKTRWPWTFHSRSTHIHEAVGGLIRIQSLQSSPDQWRYLHSNFRKERKDGPWKDFPPIQYTRISPQVTCGIVINLALYCICISS